MSLARVLFVEGGYYSIDPENPRVRAERLTADTPVLAAKKISCHVGY